MIRKNDWEPNMAKVEELAQLFIEASKAADSRSNSIILKKISVAEKHPEYACYLSFLLLPHKSVDNEIRLRATLALKNFLRHNTHKLPEHHLNYTKKSLLSSLVAVPTNLHLPIASCIAIIVEEIHISHWPDLFVFLSVFAVVVPVLLSQNEYCVYDSELDAFLPKIFAILEQSLNLGTSQVQTESKMAIKTSFEVLSEYANALSPFLLAEIENLLYLIQKVNLNDIGITGKALNLLKALLNYRIENFECYVKMNEFAIKYISLETPFLATLSCDYFNIVCYKSPKSVLSILNILIKKLVNVIPFTDEMIKLVLEEQEDFDNKKQQFDSDLDSEWNLRKASANAILRISSTVSTETINCLQPFIAKNIQLYKSKNVDWKSLETCVLILGCLKFDKNDNRQYVTVDFLLNILQTTDHLLLKSTVFWSLTNFDDFCYNDNVNFVKN